MDNREKDVLLKLSKITSYIKKAERRIQLHEKALDRLRSRINKEKRNLDGIIDSKSNKIKEVS